MARPSMHGIAWWRCFEFRAHIAIARRVARMKARRCVVWFQKRYSDFPGTSIKYSSACKYLVILLASAFGKFLGTSLLLPLNGELLFNSAGISLIVSTLTAAAIYLRSVPSEDVISLCIMCFKLDAHSAKMYFMFRVHRIDGFYLSLQDRR